MARGELPTVRIGGRVLIRRDHLTALVERATILGVTLAACTPRASQDAA
jgi:hypothetical protein